MLRDEETYFFRLMQNIDLETFNEYFTLKETTENEDGSIELHYDVHYGNDSGFLMINYHPTDNELLAVEMDVGFPTMLGLNRSPLELRILAEHVLALRAAAENDEQ